MDARPLDADRRQLRHQSSDQEVTGADFGTNLGLDLGIGGVNDPNDLRASGLPRFDIGGTTAATSYSLGTTPNWMPIFRKERSYTFSSALTKAFTTRHELRAGIDVVRHSLNHRQAEFGDYGLRGGFRFDGLVTATTGYTPLLWNQFGDFLLGSPSFFSKDVQTEEMTGREWQSRPLRPRSMERHAQADPEPRCPGRVLPADDPCRPRHRAPRLQHLYRPHRRSRRRAGRRRNRREDAGTSRRAPA